MTTGAGIRLGLAAAMLVVAAAVAADALAIDIERDGPLISVVISEPTPVDDVLARFGEEFSIEIKGRLPGATAEPVRLMRMTLPQMLGRILPGRAFSLVSDSEGRPLRIVVMGEQPGGTHEAAAVAVPQLAARPIVRMMAGGSQAALQQVARLSQEQSPAAARLLEAMALRERPVEVRIAAIHALGNFARQGSMLFLRTRLLADPSPEARLAAAEAMQAADYSAAKPVIEQALAAERDENQRQRLRELLDQ